MNTRIVTLGFVALAAIHAHATTAVSLSSFEGIEEPLVRYTPATKTFKPDALVNITDEGAGRFRMFLRYRSDEWDADRDTPNTDRQRAEVKGLGPHQKTGETFDYETTWRTNESFQGAGRFCHVFQLKSTNGDSGAPLVTLSILPGRERVAVLYWSGAMKSAATAREFPWKPGEWQTVRIRIKASNTADGEVLASVNGDDFKGVTGLAIFRPNADDYRPKWGLYRGVMPGLRFGDDFVEHKNVSAEKVTSGKQAQNQTLEMDALQRAQSSPASAISWLLTQAPSSGRNTAIATVAADWAKTDAPAAMAEVEKLSPQDGRFDAMQRVFNRWADRDVEATLRWVKAQKPSADLDQLLWYFATDTTFRYVARERALTGATLIHDSTLREQALEHVTLIWARREPEKADRYVEACAVLTAEQKAELRGKIAAMGKRKTAE